MTSISKPITVKQVGRWVEALKSGKFQQGTGSLEIGGKYCCLGVLERVISHRPVGFGSFLKRKGTGVLSDENSRRIIPAVQVFLANLNDHGFTFDQIAQIIERIPDGWFHGDFGPLVKARPITEEQITQWVKALKGGGYMQGRGALYNKRKNTYCCLGVLERVITHRPVIGNGYLPGIARLSIDSQKFLARLNDSGQFSFSEVADVIRCIPVEILRGNVDTKKEDWGHDAV